MRTTLWFILGYGLAFAAGFLAVAAGALAGIGVAAHLLLKREPGMSDVLNFDPSNMVGRAPYPAVFALGFAVLFFLVARRLRTQDRIPRERR